MTVELQTGGVAATLVILGAAGIVIPAFARARISPVVGFLLVGVLVGPHALGALARTHHWLRYFSISDASKVAPIAELGIVLLLFSIGLELSFRRLWGLRHRIIGYGGTQLLASTVLIAIMLYLAGASSRPSAALGIAVALALSSTALVLPLSGTVSPVGKLAFAMLLFEDLALVPIIFILSALGNKADFGAMVSALAGGAIVIGAMLLIGPRLLPKLFAQAARTKTPELFMSACLLVVILASLATTAVGLSPIVGALIAGVIIAETDYAHEIADVVAPFKGLALGVFLISVGMSIDLGFVLSHWVALCWAIAGVIGIKVVVMAVLLRWGGLRSAIAAETALLMASPAETTLIVLAAAVNVGLITRTSATFWQIVTAIGLTLTPLLARIGERVAGAIDRRHGGGIDPAVADAVPDDATVLIGYGRVGALVGAMLDAHGLRWRAIEANIDIVTAARAEGRPVRWADTARRGALNSLGLETARAVVLTMDDPVQAVRLTRAIRNAYPRLTIVARARDVDNAGTLYRAGASDAVPDTLESSLQLAEAVLVDLGIAVGPVIASIHEKRDELRRELRAVGELDSLPRLGSLRSRV